MIKKAIFSLVFCTTTISLWAQMNTFVGIGARLKMDSLLGYGATKIIAFIPGGSAEFSGLKVGDYIMKVNDKSAIKVPLQDVVNMLLGEEGTKVKIEVKQAAGLKTFTLIRKKITASTTYYSSELKTDFCNALTKLMNDAPYGFEHVYDSTTYVQEGEGFGGRRIHPCKVQLPGVAKTEIQNSFGLTCRVKVGEYNNEDEVNKSGEAFVKKLTDCYPDFYVFSKSTEGNSFSIQIGRKIKGGYTGAIMILYPSNNETTKKIDLFMRIETGVPHTFYTIEDKAIDSEFAKGINKIYNDILNKFDGIKTVEHKSADVFNPIYFYEINVTLPGSYKSYVDAGSMMSMRADQCVVNFYYGESLEEAEKSFKDVTSSVYDAFGSDFVYTLERPSELLESVIPEKPEKFVIFTRKKERGYESLGVCTLVLNKEADGKYRTYLTFYKTGM